MVWDCMKEGVWRLGMGWTHIVWLCICLSVYFLRRYFLLDNKPVNFLCKKSYHHCTHSVHSLLCHQHSSSPGSVRVPFSWLEMVQRSMISAFDVLSGKDKLKTQGWVQVWMLLTPDLPLSVRWVILSHGVRGPCSMFMPGSTRSSRVPDPALH